MWSMLGNVDNKDGRQLLDSGPGNNWIVHGDEQQGYFGMVAARDFIHRPEILALLPDNIGKSTGDTELIWLKAAVAVPRFRKHLWMVSYTPDEMKIGLL